MGIEPITQHFSEILDHQRKCFSSGDTLSLASRNQRLLKLEKAIIANKEIILEALGRDLNKPPLEAFLAEYHFLLQEIRHVRKSLKKWLKPKKVSSPVYFQPCRSEIFHEPYGVVVIIAPWNYPIQLSLAPLISAIAAGNTVILKPSEHAKASEALLVKLLAEVFPPELVYVATGGTEVATRLLSEKIDFIFFTGSTEVGRIVARRAADLLIPCVLELGGKCPCIVDSTADIKLAASRILSGKLFNAGQTCFAPDFVVVDAIVKEDLVEALKCELEEVPWDEEMSHIINSHHYNRLHAYLDGIELDNIICGGEDDQSLNKLAPRVVLCEEWSEQLLEEEVFGPILPVISYQSEDELINNLKTYSDPLAIYLFSNDDDFCLKIQQTKRSGGLCINDTMKQSSNLRLPFGGVGESGYGRYRGEYGVMAFSYQRAVVKRGKLGAQWMDLKPPYAKLFVWLERFMR